MQSRLMSMVEAVANIIVGYLVSVLAQMLIFPRFGIEASLVDNLAIAGCFTLISLVRAYALRRIFNRR